MQPIMKMLYRVEGECSDERPEDVDMSMDEFTRLKHSVANAISSVRALIKERDQLKVDDYRAVKLSSQIRTELVKIKSDAHRMRALQVMYARLKPKEKRYLFGLIRRPVKEEVSIADDVDHRAEIVELVFKHVAECERQSQAYVVNFQHKAKVKDLLGEDGGVDVVGDVLNDQLKSFTGYDAKMSIRMAAEAAAHMAAGNQSVDVKMGLRQIQEKDRVIEKELEEITKGVQDLRGVAENMADELKLQTAVVGELTAELDQELRNMESLNSKLGESIEQAKKNSNVLLDVFLILVIFALAGYIYTLYNPIDALGSASAEGSDAAAGSEEVAASGS